MIVKICGITILKDALAAVDAGVDMLGYNFYPLSKRYIQLEACVEIQNELARRNVSVNAVGVFVNAFREEIEQTVVCCNIDYAQLSGDETPEFAAGLDVPWFKAIRPKSTLEAEGDGKTFGRGTSPGLLVDSFHPGQYGGTGEVGDWGVASVLSRHFSILLAGGLTPENVASAIEQVCPWGVDVASGVESAPGVKYHEKIRLFVRHAKEVF